MSYKVKGYDLSKINLSPATVEEEVLQNVAIILSTWRGSCPLAREIGLRGEFIDKPAPVARTMSVSDITESLQSQEPRAEIVGITFEQDANNPDKQIPIVEVNVNNG